MHAAIWNAMDMLAHLRRLFAYDHWANREVLSGLKAAGSLPARPVQLLSHILSAERLWLERIERRQATYPVWSEFSIVKCEAEVIDLPRLWQKYLGGIQAAQFVSGSQLHQQQGRILDQFGFGHSHARDHALCLPSWPDRDRHASRGIHP